MVFDRFKERWGLTFGVVQLRSSLQVPVGFDRSLLD